jgi:hypothetical protein
VRSSFVSISIWLRAFRFRNHVVSSSAALAILLGPGTLQAQYISYAGTQTVFPLTGVVEPIAIAVDARGNRYIVDNESANLTEVSVGGVESTINSTLSGPNGIAVDAAGNLYVADSGNNRVLEIAAGGGAQTTVPITGLRRRQPGQPLRRRLSQSARPSDCGRRRSNRGRPNLLIAAHSGCGRFLQQCLHY